MRIRKNRVFLDFRYIQLNSVQNVPIIHIMFISIIFKLYLIINRLSLVSGWFVTLYAILYRIKRALEAIYTFSLIKLNIFLATKQFYKRFSDFKKSKTVSS